MAKHRRLVGASIAASIAALVPAGLAAADDPKPPDEAYPPRASTTTIVDPGIRELPKTGADSSGDWLKFGAGAILVGGVLVAATARRRHTSSAATR